ncbi:hypothetical protein D3C80_698470 [compost metagenome]
MLALGWMFGVGRLWPHDGLPVAASDHEQPLPAGGSAEVACLDDPPLHLVAHAFEQVHEAAPGDAAALRVWHEELLLHRHTLSDSSDRAVQLHHPPGVLVALGHQRTPLKDLLNVL